MSTRHAVVIGATLTPVHYVHFRLVDDTKVGGKIEENLWSYGGATLAYALTEDEGQPSLIAALTLCHSFERFQKVEGQNHARGRLTRLLAHNFKLPDDTDPFYTCGVDKYYVLPGPVDVVLRELIEEIEDGTGYLVR